MGSLRSVPPYSLVPWTNHPLAPGPFSIGKKVYPWGAPPRVSSRVQTPPRDVSPPISSSHGVSKSRCALRMSSFQFDQSRCSRWSTHCSPLCYTPYLSRSCLICCSCCATSRWVMNVYKPCSEDAPTKSYERGPERCRGIIPLPGNSIMRSIAVVWLVSLMAFHFSGVGPFSLYLF